MPAARERLRGTSKVAVLVVVLAFAPTTSAGAAELIRACAGAQDGALRIVGDANGCRAGENPLSWAADGIHCWDLDESRSCDFASEDADGDGDCDVDDCRMHVCVANSQPEICNDAIDNDCDGATDAEDAGSGCCVPNDVCQPPANGSAVCNAAGDGCVLTSCRQGFANCDGDDSNGCESGTNTIVNCGGCGNVCAPGQACFSGICSG